MLMLENFLLKKLWIWRIEVEFMKIVTVIVIVIVTTKLCHERGSSKLEASRAKKTYSGFLWVKLLY